MSTPDHEPTPGFHPVAHALQAVITLSNEIERELVRLLGLNLTDYRALTMLASAGPTTGSALAERIGSSAATTTAILNRLEAAGYVRRSRIDADRRRVHVSVAPDVYPKIMGLMGPLVRRVDDEVTSLPAGQQDVVEAFFGRVTHLLEDHLGQLSQQPAPEAATAGTDSDGAPTVDN